MGMIRELSKIEQPSPLFNELTAIYKEMGMGDNILTHSPARIFEYDWALSMNISNMKENLRILDAGCGSSPLPVYLKRVYPNSDVTGIDAQSSFDGPTFSFKPEWKEQFGVNYTRANMIDYRTKVFDRIYCISVLEHIYRPVDRIRAIVNLWENLRDGGRLIMTWDYSNNIAAGLQWLLLDVSDTIDCVWYDKSITALCLEKKIDKEGIGEGAAEWIQMNEVK